MSEQKAVLPPSKRLEIMEIAIHAAREINDCARFEDKDDAAVVVAAILEAINTINRCRASP